MAAPINPTTLALFLIGVIIIYGLVAKGLFKAFRIPDVLPLILFGAFMSYMGLTDVLKGDSPILTVLVTFALIYIVFNGGLPIRIKAVMSSAKWAFISAILNFVVITSVVGGIAWAFGFPLRAANLSALYIGALLCVMDGSIINSIIEILPFSHKAEAFIQIESAIIDTLVIVAIFAIMNIGTVDAMNVFQLVVYFLLLSSAIGVFAGMLWAAFIRRLGSMHHVSLSTLAILIMVYVFAELVQANGVIAVFAFAIFMGNIKQLTRIAYKDDAKTIKGLSREQKVFFSDFSFLLRTLLFFYIGALIDFSMPWYLLLGLLLALVAYLLRSLIFMVVKTEDIPKKDVAMMEVMATKGLTPVVMISLIHGSVKFTNTIIGAIFFSVLLSSILIPFIQREKFYSIRHGIYRMFCIFRAAEKTPQSSGENSL